MTDNNDSVPRPEDDPNTKTLKDLAGRARSRTSCRPRPR